MFVRVVTIRAGRCKWVKNDSKRTGGQGVAGSNPVIPTNVYWPILALLGSAFAL